MVGVLVLVVGGVAVVDTAAVVTDAGDGHTVRVTEYCCHPSCLHTKRILTSTGSLARPPGLPHVIPTHPTSSHRLTATTSYLQISLAILTVFSLHLSQSISARELATDRHPRLLPRLACIQ